MSDCLCCQSPWPYDYEEASLNVSLRKYDNSNPPEQQWWIDPAGGGSFFVAGVSHGQTALGVCVNGGGFGATIAVYEPDNAELRWVSIDASDGGQEIVCIADGTTGDGTGTNDADDVHHRRAVPGFANTRLARRRGSDGVLENASLANNIGGNRHGLYVEYLDSTSYNVYVGTFGIMYRVGFGPSSGPDWSNVSSTTSYSSVILAGGNAVCGSYGSGSEGATTVVVRELNYVDGTTNWSKTSAETGVASVNSIAADSMGGIFVCGIKYVTGGGAAYSTDGILAKLDSTGGSVWSVEFTDSIMRAVAVNSSDEIVVVGQTDGTYDAHLYDTSGTEIWSANLHNWNGMAQEESLYCATFDSSDNLYVGGKTVPLNV